MPEERPALFGGRPVFDNYLSYGKHSMIQQDIEAVVSVLRSDWITTGPSIARFEEETACRLDAAHAVAVSSGTAALHCAAFAAGFGEGDEVITTPMTFASTANCILFRGATPVFTDIDPNTLNVDPAEIEKNITKRTRAIIPVHFGGLPCDMDEIGGLARDHGLLVIEDAAHALGALYRGRKVGSISEFTTFSFHPVKHITTGEGGLVTTPTQDAAAAMRGFRNHGIGVGARERQDRGQYYYEINELGFNYRITDFQCALGLSQLERLDEFLNRRKELAGLYFRKLQGVPGITLPPLPKEEGTTHAWHLFVVQLDEEVLRASRDQYFKALRAENVGVNVHYIPVYLHPYYQRVLGTGEGLCPRAEAYFKRSLTLPLHVGMSEGDVDRVVLAIQKIANWFRTQLEGG